MICRVALRPDARNVGRQYVCGAKACQAERHRRACADWRKRNPHYDRQDRLERRLVKGEPVRGAADPLQAIDWEAAKDVVGLEPAVLIEIVAKSICQWLRDGLSA